MIIRHPRQQKSVESTVNQPPYFQPKHVESALRPGVDSTSVCSYCPPSIQRWMGGERRRCVDPFSTFIQRLWSNFGRFNGSLLILFQVDSTLNGRRPTTARRPLFNLYSTSDYGRILVDSTAVCSYCSRSIQRWMEGDRRRRVDPFSTFIQLVIMVELWSMLVLHSLIYLKDIMIWLYN